LRTHPRPVKGAKAYDCKETAATREKLLLVERSIAIL
jgi:hypothetical protein